MSNKILFVEDEEDLTLIVSDTLRGQGYDIITAADGIQGLEKFKSEGADIVVADVMMPKINGYKISRLLKYDAKYKNIPILMVTARSQEEDKLIGEETGADEYITKPFDLDEVVKKVEQYLGKN